ncbi:hypothetical protein QYE76_069511 [Lolium multiflorum]|uniref:Uncharacterized protein n=1 Tax=Lolium multiflorum TaxID=4521 RepID=A0AAD8WCQ1_LOLMU|nr:hypothetical protein QYE76_069511 [Lolium multiflorum]
MGVDFVQFREYFVTRISETKNSRKQELALRHLVNSRRIGRHRPAPVDWDPYEPVQYDAPENPYDTSIVDNEPEVQSSDVDSDDESFHTKTRHVLRRLQSGHYDGPFARGIYKCPFCNRKLRATDFNSLVNHAESIGRCGARVGRTVNVHAFMAKHKALGIHLRNLQASHTRYLEALNVPTALSPLMKEMVNFGSHFIGFYDEAETLREALRRAKERANDLEEKLKASEESREKAEKDATGVEDLR